jgi:hypothetical protein
MQTHPLLSTAFILSLSYTGLNAWRIRFAGAGEDRGFDSPHCRKERGDCLAVVPALNYRVRQ